MSILIITIKYDPWNLPGSVKDEQVDGCAKIAPVVAMYAGRPEMLEKVEAAVKVTQKPGMAVAAAMVTARLECSITTYLQTN